MAGKLFTSESGEIYHSPQDEVDFHDMVDEKLAPPHIGGPLGIYLMDFTPLDPNTRYQRLAVTHRPVNPNANIKDLKYLMNKIIGKKRVNDLVAGYRSRPDLLNSRRMDMLSGMDVGTITDHEDLIGVTIAFGGELLAHNDERLMQRSAIVVSKLITRLGVVITEIVDGEPTKIPVPAMDALTSAATVFTSIPRTETIWRSGLQNSIAEYANANLHEDLHDWRQQGGTFTVMAPSGSVYRRKDGIIYAQRMSSGTAQSIAELDRVLDVAIFMDAPDDEPWFEIGDYTDSVHDNPDRAHEVMETNSERLSRLTGETVIYKSERSFSAETAKVAAHQAGEKAAQTTHNFGRVVSEFMKRREERRNRNK